MPVMVYTDEDLPDHPKVYRAGAIIGPHGPARALALYLAGLSYARKWLTDGFVSDEFVASSRLVREPILVAKALADDTVRLWHKTTGGYTIHDFEHWNQKSSDIKQKRELARLRKQRQRRRDREPPPESVTGDVTPDVTLDVTCDGSWDSRGTLARVARARAVPLPLPLRDLCTGDQIQGSTSHREEPAPDGAALPTPSRDLTLVRRLRSPETDDGRPKLSVLTALARTVLSQHHGVTDEGERAELLKVACAQHHLLYDSATVARALERAAGQLQRRRVAS